MLGPHGGRGKIPLRKQTPKVVYLLSQVRQGQNQVFLPRVSPSLGTPFSSSRPLRRCRFRWLNSKTTKERLHSSKQSWLRWGDDAVGTGSGVRDWLRACDCRGNRAYAMPLRICRMGVRASDSRGLPGVDFRSTSVRIRTTATTLGVIRHFHGLLSSTAGTKIRKLSQSTGKAKLETSDWGGSRPGAALFY